MLLPDGSATNWDQLAELLTAGLTAVKEVDPEIQTVLHLDRGDDNLASRWWFDEALSRGVKFDIIAQSCYSTWQGLPEEWEQNFVDLAERYPDHSVVIAEYADNYRAANDVMFNLPRRLGTFIWEPMAQGEWGPGLFVNGAAVDTIHLYDQTAEDYGLR